MVENDFCKDLLNEIIARGAIIYGTGYVAERFIESLKTHEVDCYVNQCVTTHKHGDEFKGYKVRGIDELKNYYNGELICIAVHEAIKDEIISILKAHSFDLYTWIYPYLHKLEFGEAIEINKEVEIINILNAAKDDYKFAVRIAAIDQYYGENDCGYSIYLKAQSQHCDTKTAQKRLVNFIELIKSWDINGFFMENRPLIATDYEVIDGLHRLSLALYHGIKLIPCDIYRAEEIRKYRGDSVDIVEDILKKAGLTKKEIRIIETVQRDLMGTLDRAYDK